MAMLVMGLFDDPKSAQEALRALEAEGFSSDDVEVRSGDQLTAARGMDQSGESNTGRAKQGDDDNDGMLARIRHYLSDIGLSKGQSSKNDPSRRESSKQKSSANQTAAVEAPNAGAQDERELGDSDVLILVNATDDTAEQAADILGEYGVSDLVGDGEGCVRVYSVVVEGDVMIDDGTQSENAAGRRSDTAGSLGSESTGRLSATEEREFQNDWQAKHTGASELTADEALPGYQYGYRLGQNPQHSDSEWSAVESQARRDWDERRFGPWERLKEAVKSGWERAHQH